MFDWIGDPQAWIALATLTTLEIVLGVDNIIFITILASKLPVSQQGKARQIGLLLAMVMRILLLLSIAWIVRLTTPLFSIFQFDLSGRDLILLGGGLFLLAKAVHEIHDKLEGEQGGAVKKVTASFTAVLVQIMLLDMVFSIDSVITAVGMANDVGVMIIAVVLAVIVMMISAKRISSFVDKHPTIKILALSFLLLIGTSLIAEGLHFHIPKGYIYFAMAFSVGIELLNMRMRKKGDPVALHGRYKVEEAG
ncbi:MAG TPA: TerC family protein [Thermoanaerobaculia bacterium]|nr:TerC family protein [Thermoanaerobaculia bacterium]